MNENGFYLIKQDFFDLIKNYDGNYSDSKQRPVYCCIKDKYTEGLYWAIPTSDISHRTQQQTDKYTKYINLPKKIFVLLISILATLINLHYIK